MGAGVIPPESFDPAEVYETLLVPHAFAPWARDLVRRAGPQSSERVLDAACGTGIVARTVLPLVGPTGRVAGVDLSPGMLAVARSRVPGDAPVGWHEASADALPFPGAAFDLVLCQQGLQFFPDKPGAVREFRRVLAPSGRVALSVWRSLEHHPVHEAMDEVVVRHLGASATAVAFSSSVPELEALLAGAGFGDVAIEPVTKTLRFPSADCFVRSSIFAAAAVLPVFAELDEAGQAALGEAMRRELSVTLRRHVHGDGIAVPMAAFVATARVPASQGPASARSVGVV